MRFIAWALIFLFEVIATVILILWMDQYFDWTYLKQLSFLCYSPE